MSKFGPRLAGAGGFINISQNARTVVFVGTFTAGQLEVRLDGGQVAIAREGGARKFVREVEHRTFSGAEAVRRGQRVLYVTERAVFRLVPQGDGAGGELELCEIAPGIDLQRDVLAYMAFQPRIAADLKTMDARLFRAEPLGLRAQLLERPLAERMQLDRAARVLHIDFSGLQVNSSATIAAIDAAVRALLQPFGERVDAVVNYDHFGIVPELVDVYADMVHRLAADWYQRVTRYGTTGFVKSRLKPSPGD